MTAGLITAAPLLTSSGNSYLLSSRVIAEATAIPGAIAILLTGGFSTAGDGGGALYIRGDATQPGGFTDANGGEWELASQVLNPLMFGCVGDGVTDDSAAYQSFIDLVGARGTAGYHPGGFAFTINEQIENTDDNVTLYGDGWNSRVIWGGAALNVNLLYCLGDNVYVRDMQFEGDVYSTFPDTIYPNTLVRFGDIDNAISTSRVRNVRFLGGRSGCFMWNSEKSDISDVECQSQYEYGFAVSSGVRQCITKGFKAYDTGLYNGYKFGFNETRGGNSDALILDDFIIERAGRLDSNQANWQECLDVYVGDFKQVMFSNMWLRYGGAGGAELKSDKSTNPGALDELEDIFFNNVHVVRDNDYTGANGFTMNWSGIDTPAATKGRRIHYVDCSETCVDDAIGIGHTVIVNAYHDVNFTNFQVRDGGRFMRLNGLGDGPVDYCSEITVTGGKVRCANECILQLNGGLQGLTLNQVDMESENESVVVLGDGSSPTGSTTIRINGGRIVAQAVSVNKNALQFASTTDVVVDGAYLEAESRVVSVPNGTLDSDNILIKGYGTIKARTNLGSSYAITNSDPACTITSRDIYYDIPDSNARSHAAFAGTIVNINAIRNPVTVAPVTQGAGVGDVFPIINPAAGAYSEYICPNGGAADNSATWKGRNAIAP